MDLIAVQCFRIHDRQSRCATTCLTFSTAFATFPAGSESPRWLRSRSSAVLLLAVVGWLSGVRFHTRAKGQRRVSVPPSAGGNQLQVPDPEHDRLAGQLKQVASDFHDIRKRENSLDVLGGRLPKVSRRGGMDGARPN